MEIKTGAGGRVIRRRRLQRRERRSASGVLLPWVEPGEKLDELCEQVIEQNQERPSVSAIDRVNLVAERRRKTREKLDGVVDGILKKYDEMDERIEQAHVSAHAKIDAEMAAVDDMGDATEQLANQFESSDSDVVRRVGNLSGAGTGGSNGTDH